MAARLRGPSEHSLQVAVNRMLQLVLDPERTWYSALDHAAKLSPRYGADRKKRGVRAGMPDFIVMTERLPLGATSMYPAMFGIELKIKKGKLSPSQIEVRDAWQRVGNPIYVARSLEEVQEILDFCRVPMLRRMTFFGGGHERAQRPAATRHPRPQRRGEPKGAVPLVLRHQAQKD